MALSAGTRLGPYEILAPLGAGGMGEVYRASDTKLGRQVAIKVLPPDLTQDPERLARFQREAHLLASLNHPHIAAIHGLEEADGQPFLVLELVEGEDLKERLGRGAIPVDEALEIAEQVAEALEEAHNHGIVHRDLKPANVKLTPEGKVKVLDFGLAKAWAGDEAERASSSASMSESPTLAHSGTAAGIILGTAAYMSPEQARGRPVDKRADVWSFGVLLWEMLTGQALFSGDTVTDVIAAVVTKEPDLDALPAGTPPAVPRLLGRCLRKDPRKRLPDIGAARLELEDLLAGTEDTAGASGRGEGTPPGEARRVGRLRWALAAAGLVIAGLATTLAVTQMGESPEAPAAHFVAQTPAGFSMPFFRRTLAPSPDGRHVAFEGQRDGVMQLWVRPLDSPEARPLPGTEGAVLPFWSPDNEWIAFFSDTHLSKVRLAGGSVQQVCARPDGALTSGTWGREGTIVFSAGKGGERTTLFSVAAAGGEARPLTTLDESRGETGHRWPHFLPDGDRLLFLVRSTREESTGLYVASLETPGQRRRILSGDARILYASGHMLFVRDRTLLAQSLDVERLEVSGEPIAVAQDVYSYRQGSGWGVFGASSNGVLAYLESGVSHVQLAWLDREGRRLGTLGEPGPYGQIALSPDGRRVALEAQDDRGWDLWVMDTSRGVASRVTSDPAEEQGPVWSPDGKELAFARRTTDDLDIFRTGLHAGASATRLLEAPGHDWPEDWSRDGKTLFYIAAGQGHSLWALPLAGNESPELVLKTGFFLAEPRLSPDGRWLAYLSRESGRWEVYIEPFRRQGERVRVSAGGGGQPKWRADGKELFYWVPDGPLVAVEVRENADRLDLGPPIELFAAGVVGHGASNDYGVSADGQRFLVKLPVEESTQAQIHVVTNWTSLLH